MSKYRIIIAALDEDGKEPIQVYEQVVDGLYIRGVIEAVNADPKRQTLLPKRRKVRADKGKSRRKTAPEIPLP